MKDQEIQFDIENIASAAADFLKLTAGYHVFAFSGELGAGKTTFISALCRQLGVTEIVSSPTFAIIQQYAAAKAGNVFHMDLYRIKDEEEAIHSGLEDALLSGDICMVEWPENAAGVLPEQTVYTKIEITGKRERKLHIQMPE